MLLKFAGIRKQYAIGMRWAVDDRRGIEAIQFNTNLHYGIMLDVREKNSRRLKLVALADDTHKKAICLAGLLANQYENLILVHRMSDVAYWVCIIKNHAVWTGVDVPKATAGDFVGGFVSVSEVIEIAKAEFVTDGVNLQNIVFCSETANEDFGDFQLVDFFTFITKLKKNRTYVVRYLEPSKILLRKILLLAMFVIGLLIAGYYIQQKRLVTRLIYQQQIEQERQQQLARQAKADYFSHIQNTLHTRSGNVVVQNVFMLLQMIPLQSAGWNLVSSTYNSQDPRTMLVFLKRSEYGTLDSFLNAYSQSPTNGAIDSSNNSGRKTLTFSDVKLQEATNKITEDFLTVQIPREAYRLISYMQLNTDVYKFQLKNKTKSQYGVNSMTFSLAGDQLWQLMQLNTLLTEFPTLMISSISFTVNNFDMSWALEGEIYA